MTGLDELPPTLRDADPSVRYVYTVLQAADGWVGYDDLRARTGYSQPTVSRAARRLTRRDLAVQRRDPDEPRRCELRVADDDADAGPGGAEWP